MSIVDLETSTNIKKIYKQHFLVFINSCSFYIYFISINVYFKYLFLMVLIWW